MWLSRFSFLFFWSLSSLAFAANNDISNIVGPPSPLTAQDQIKQEVNSFLHGYLDLENKMRIKRPGERKEIMLGNIDPLLQLKPCAEKITITPPLRNQRNGKFSLKAQCKLPSPWSLYIPVRVQHYQLVVIAAEPIIRGSAINPRQLMLQEVEISTLNRGYYQNFQSVTGFIAKRGFKTNESIYPSGLVAPMLISKGEHIVIKASLGKTLKVRALGVALSNGALGDIIQVRNKSSQKVVEGRVKSAGVIEVVL
jgi:flagella basal body P-ring formation protein FlgA